MIFSAISKLSGLNPPPRWTSDWLQMLLVRSPTRLQRIRDSAGQSHTNFECYPRGVRIGDNFVIEALVHGSYAGERGISGIAANCLPSLALPQAMHGVIVFTDRN
ncbi:hypothetical protein TNCT_142991 [Trichonephila clavata]|uniref:Uncharacterized protein n=1 Tax=Trichonephila clavata TaxID=2740835 RepID=A0A8X6FK98_TRICU|nr:hypothetical protein TNCT_142991 [Trichonephila clavata]